MRRRNTFQRAMRFMSANRLVGSDMAGSSSSGFTLTTLAAAKV